MIADRVEKKKQHENENESKKKTREPLQKRTRATNISYQNDPNLYQIEMRRFTPPKHRLNTQEWHQ
jgi:hypothetical protein